MPWTDDCPGHFFGSQGPASSNSLHRKGLRPNSPICIAESFLKATELDMETLKLKAYVKDASFFKILAPRADGMIYHIPTSTIMGRNSSEIVEYLKNPLNENILVEIMNSIDVMWNE